LTGVSATNYATSSTTFSGANDFVSTTTIRKVPVVNAATGTTLTVSSAGITVFVSSNTAQSVNLPSVDATNIGISFRIVKGGTGSVTIHAADSDIIADSSAGGHLVGSSSLQSYANVTLLLVDATHWIVTGGDGDWASN
jgi:hypothetical protein